MASGIDVCKCKVNCPLCIDSYSLCKYEHSLQISTVYAWVSSQWYTMINLKKMEPVYICVMLRSMFVALYTLFFI